MSLVWLQGSVLQFGSGGGIGGSGFTLGPETNQFTTIAARNTYATANTDWLAEYDDNATFLVEITISGVVTYYRRFNSAWEEVTNIIKGREGDKGDAGDTGRSAKGDLVATYTVPAAHYTSGREYIPGGLVLENANANVWSNYSPGALYEGALTADPQIRHFSSGYNFYFNPTTDTWRRAGPADADFADAVWEDVATADIPGLLDYRYPSDTLNFTWLGMVADEAAANTSATSPDDLTITYAAFYDNALKWLNGRSNAVGHAVYDIGTDDYGKRSVISFPKAHTNQNVIGAIVEVLYGGTVIDRGYSTYGDLGFGTARIGLDDGSSIGLGSSGGANTMTFYLAAYRNNATVGAMDNVQLNVYEWGT